MKKLLLVGGGLAHLKVLKMLQSKPIKDVETVLISPSSFQYYSAMFPGYAEGIYSESEIRIDLEKLALKANVKWLEDAVTAIDPKQKQLLTATGKVMAYDAVSFDIGSLTSGTDLPGVKEYAARIKPNYHFTAVIDDVRRANKVVIAGGGPSAVEIALSLEAWRKANDIETPVTLLTSSRLLPHESKKISNKMTKLSLQKGIQVITEKPAAKIEKNRYVATSGESIPFDKIIWMEGSKSPGMFKVSNLPVDEKGYLKVEGTLQVKKYPAIFGAGDCVSLSDHQRIRKAGGGDSARQGSVLFNNLKGFFETGDGERFRLTKKSPFCPVIGEQRRHCLL